MLLATLLTIWSAGLLTVCTVLFLHFETTLFLELLLTLKRIGWRKGHPMWNDPVMEYMTPSQIQMWIIMAETRRWVGRGLSHILTCPGCLSVHVSFWTAALSLLLMPADTLSSTKACLTFLLVCTLTWPWLANRLLRKPHSPKHT